MEEYGKPVKQGEPTIQSLLVRPAIILSNSADVQILKATVYILSELVSASDIVAQILSKADSDFECTQIEPFNM